MIRRRICVPTCCTSRSSSRSRATTFERTVFDFVDPPRLAPDFFADDFFADEDRFFDDDFLEDFFAEDFFADDFFEVDDRFEDGLLRDVLGLFAAVSPDERSTSFEKRLRPPG